MKNINDHISSLLPCVGRDEIATRYFLRLFTSSDELFSLDRRSVKAIRRAAESGDRYAQFAYGRYLYATVPEKGSEALAREMFVRSYDQALPEATAALSNLWNNGDLGLVDRERSLQFLNEALEMGSDYAYELQTRFMTYGIRGFAADPAKAVQILDGLIEKDINGGLSPSPMWYYNKACAVEQLYGRSASLTGYQKAASAGVKAAWFDIAVAKGYADGDELVDQAEYLAALKDGGRNGCTLCTYFLALHKVEEWEDKGILSRALATRRLLNDLERSYKAGNGFAAEYVGDILYNGWFGLREDKEAAWGWYSRAARLSLCTAYEKMYEMSHGNQVDKPLEFIDMLALHGARLGSRRMLDEVVAIYGEGRLADFSSEIEKYYLPVARGEDDVWAACGLHL